MRIVLLLLFTVITCVEGFSSELLQFNKLSSKVGYQNYPWMGDDCVVFLDRKTPIGYFDVFYNLNRTIKLGVKVGYGKYQWLNLEMINFDNIDEEMFIEPSMKSILVYGLTMNLSLLPLFVKGDISFIDMYIASHFGAIYLHDKNSNLHDDRPLIDYGIYGGITLYPWKHVGIFYEYGIGNCVTWKTGLGFRF